MIGSFLIWQIPILVLRHIRIQDPFISIHAHQSSNINPEAAWYLAASHNLMITVSAHWLAFLVAAAAAVLHVLLHTSGRSRLVARRV
jgi:hypothetical protein